MNTQIQRGLVEIAKPLHQSGKRGPKRKVILGPLLFAATPPTTQKLKKTSARTRDQLDLRRLGNHRRSAR